MLIHLSWTDPRLQYEHLHQDYHLNVLTLDFKKRIWLPALVFANTLSNTEVNFIGQSQGFIEIKDGATFTTDLQTYWNKRSYAGSDW